MFGSNLLVGGLTGIAHLHRVLVADVGDNLVAQGKNSVFVAFFVFVYVHGRNGHRSIPFCGNLLTGECFVVFLDMYHEHMQMEQFFLLHTITFPQITTFFLNRYSLLVMFILDSLRAGGALIGLAIGDAMGAPLEGLPPPGRRVRELLPGGRNPRKAGEFTDDTLQALAVAESLAACRGFCPEDILSRMIRDFQRDPSWYGPTSGGVFTLVVQGADPGRAAALVHGRLGGSRTNGSVMRGPPLGIWCAGPELEAISCSLSRLTHHDPVAGACSAWVNRMVSDLCRGRSREQAFYRALQRCRSEEVSGYLGQYQAASPVPGLDALEATHASLSVFMDGQDFEEVVSGAVSMGGDADTVGAIAGALAGAAFGVRGIPARWLAGLQDRERVWRAAAGLCEVAQP